jgi:hypothetical protein
MGASIAMMTPGPAAVINPYYDNRGYVFNLMALRNMQTPPTYRFRVLNFSDQLLYSGTVSWSPVQLKDGSNGWPAFKALHYVATTKPKGCYFFASNANFLDDVAIGVGDGATAVYQIREPMEAGNDVSYKNIYFPIHGWASPLDVLGQSLQNTLVVTVDNVLETHWTVNNATGKITFAGGHIPDIGAVVRVTCYYVIGVFPMDLQPEITWTSNLANIKDYRLQEIPQ